MNENLTTSTKTEKNLEENSLFIMSESKVIFKNNTDTLSLNLNLISRARLVKNRDFTANVLVLLFLALFYFLEIAPMDLNFLFSLIYIALISFVFLISFLIKKHRYILLIHTSKFNFNEITISKKNIPYAENFIKQFTKDSVKDNLEKTTTETPYFPVLEESLNKGLLFDTYYQ